MHARDYFIATAAIWRSYYAGTITMRERKDSLHRYRSMLANNKVYC